MRAASLLGPFSRIQPSGVVLSTTDEAITVSGPRGPMVIRRGSDATAYRPGDRVRIAEGAIIGRWRPGKIIVV